jgi:2-methylisocitrate lyase-like PEP mutase family enzyme
MPADRASAAQRFLDLHYTEHPLLMPNAWDLGSARLLASLGFEALATTSSGFAASLGRLDGDVSREEAVTHARSLSDATGLPVSGDFENGFADDPSAVAETIGLALDAGLAGCSVEDWGGKEIYDRALAAERVAAAAQAAHAGPAKLVLTARAENHIRGRDDLDDTIARLRSYQDAGADVLFAPGLRSIEQISTLLDALDRPLNVLVGRGSPPIAELAGAGVSRISVGGAFAFAAYATLIESARELREAGTYGYADLARAGVESVRSTF